MAKSKILPLCYAEPGKYHPIHATCGTCPVSVGCLNQQDRLHLPPQCPDGHAMVLREAYYGAKAGHQFWGCSQYPKCTYLRPLSNEAPSEEAVRAAESRVNPEVQISRTPGATLEWSPAFYECDGKLVADVPRCVNGHISELLVFGRTSKACWYCKECGTYFDIPDKLAATAAAAWSYYGENKPEEKKMEDRDAYTWWKPDVGGIPYCAAGHLMVLQMYGKVPYNWKCRESGCERQALLILSKDEDRARQIEARYQETRRLRGLPVNRGTSMEGVMETEEQKARRLATQGKGPAMTDLKASLKDGIKTVKAPPATPPRDVVHTRLEQCMVDEHDRVRPMLDAMEIEAEKAWRALAQVPTQYMTVEMAQEVRERVSALGKALAEYRGKKWQ